MPDGSITVVLQGKKRIKVNYYVTEEPYFQANISSFDEVYPSEDETKALMINLKTESSRIIELSPNIPSEANITLNNLNSLNLLVHFIASNIKADVKDKQKILEMPTLNEKARKVLGFMSNELDVLELSDEIQSKVKNDLDRQQRDFILRQQVKAIQEELGEGDDDMEGFLMRGEKKKWSMEVAETFEKEVSKLARLNPSSPEYSVLCNYLDWLLDLPWQDFTNDRLDLVEAKKILDKDHFGIEKVKARIIEHLAVIKLKKNMKAPILCFYGPPGVGKTSLGKSIAQAMKRKFVRISLGGVRDEAEIRGHRRTYIGAMPGRIMQGLKKAKSGNPVFILDEIDKLGNDWKGDPSSALLEVLDPEQNNTFNDHFVELDYDLSSVMFITTANSLDTIHPALRDRLEIIEINGYSLEEKIEIAKKHLLLKARKEHGLTAKNMVLKDEALNFIIDAYTRESGVRNLQQKLNQIARSVAVTIVNGTAKSVTVDHQFVEKVLGMPRFERDLKQKDTIPGIATGLAWTSVGGEILFIESILMKGTGKLSLSGQLGDVMKESANLAYIYLKSKADELGLDPKIFTENDIHIHIPAGATPKDGPSAGITMLSALASLFTGKTIDPELAMTGEITLRGKVLPVGGIKEKLLAAVRSGMTKIVMCKDNRKDVLEIEGDYLKSLEITYVETMDEVLKTVLR